MSQDWSIKELQLFMHAWKIAIGDPPNNNSSNDFPRSTAQIEQKKSKFLHSYALIRLHMGTLDIILGDDYTKDDKKDGESHQGPTVPQKNKTKATTEIAVNEGSTNTGQAPKMSEDQRDVRAKRGLDEHKTNRTKAVRSKEK
ncbi:Hypothetical predicted protein [Octopus vulgaris]|uniref:Uncharacterized protein n=1 Tax=Octopus vulgaris TaxID=6645 RepID=A0AA36AQF0_OCTVU|nr:Hypothetical predicted protein [Octopus vulgaris]